MVSAFGGGYDEPTEGTDRPQFESTDTLKAARFLKFVTILKLLRNFFNKNFEAKKNPGQIGSCRVIFRI